MAATPVTCFPAVVRSDTSDEYYDPCFCCLVVYLFVCLFIFPEKGIKEFSLFGEGGGGGGVEGNWHRRWLGADKP